MCRDDGSRILWYCSFLDWLSTYRSRYGCYSRKIDDVSVVPKNNQNKINLVLEPIFGSIGPRRTLEHTLNEVTHFRVDATSRECSDFGVVVVDDAEAPEAAVVRARDDGSFGTDPSGWDFI